jgi:biotin carboxylase
MKRLLLLEANGNAGEDLLEAARELDVEVYVATHEDVYENYPPAVRERIAEVVFTNYASPDTALKGLVEFARRKRVDGVITGWEFLSPLVTRLTAELGLPGHDPERADACRNKRLMALEFGAHSVPAPRTVTASSYDAVADQLARSGLDFPLVVKPAENAGSVGVSVVRSPRGLATAFQHAQGWSHEFPHGIPLDTTVLLQEYLDGPEFSVETVVFRGSIHHLAITQKFTTDGACRAEIGHTVPADLDADSRRAVLDTVEKGLTALGFRNGLAHTELKLLSDGQAKIIEVGARPPGDHIMKLVRHATGVNEARAYIQVALGEKPDVEPRTREAAAIRFITAPRAGVFMGVRSIPDSPMVVHQAVYLRPGAPLKDPEDNVGRVGHVIVKAGSQTEVNEVAAGVMAALSVEVG